MRKEKKVCILLFSILALLFICSKKADAATVLWPIGGNNAGETSIEYGFQRRTYNSTSYIYECKGKYGIDVSEGYYYCTENHYGVDIIGIPGNSYSVVAVANGTVVGTSANYGNVYVASTNYVDRNQRRTNAGLIDGGGYGNFVVIEDSVTKKCYVYAHLKAGTITVRKGDYVSAGQELAKMGSSGDSGHMHLHFEVRSDLDSTFQTPYAQYTYFSWGDNAKTENPINYIGTMSPRTGFEDRKLVTAEHNQVAQYVRYLYRAALGREASDEEAEGWARHYDDTNSIAQVTKGIVLSQEALNHMGVLSDSDFLKYQYRILLQRRIDPSDAEISGHLSQLTNGNWNREDAITMFCNCQEFKNRFYDIVCSVDNKAWTPSHKEAAIYVKYLYRSSLGREASDTEANNWATNYEIDSSIARISRGIILSQEGLNHMGELDNRQYVEYVCNILLNNPDDNTINYLTDKLDHLAFNRYDVINYLCNQDAFVSEKVNSIMAEEKQRLEDLKNTIPDIAPENMLFKKGDLDGDGCITSCDASIVLKLYVSNSNVKEKYSYVTKYADMDNNGLIDAVDACYILSYYSALSVGNIDENTTMDSYVVLANQKYDR